MSKHLDEAEWKLDCLNSRMDALIRDDAVLRKWKVTGRVAGGKETTKIVEAKDHNEATLKGSKQPPVMIVRSVVLQDSRSDADDPCWEGWQQRGTKEKGGETVPNCVKADMEPLTRGEA